MAPHEEKRSDQRYARKSPMKLHRIDYQDQCFYAEMNDNSSGGLSIVTNEKLEIGQLVYLEMENHNEPTAPPEKNKNHIGIVRWAKPYPSGNAPANGRYKYGIEYSGSSSYHC